MDNETNYIGVNAADKIKELETKLEALTNKNAALQKAKDDGQQERVEFLTGVSELFRPVIDRFNFLDEYEVKDIAEEKAREALDDFDISEFSSEISEIARDDFDINDWHDEIRSICGLDDEITDAPNQLDNIRDIIREELKGAIITGEIKLSDE
jgi:vacuolar-type H+-ATPase subunit I/STV1